MGGMVTPPAFQSLGIAWRSWLQFMLETFVLAGLLIPAVLFSDSQHLGVLLSVSAWFFFISFIYFRLLGVLGHRIEVSLNAHYDRLDKFETGSETETETETSE
ncbi:MAG: hypothetical protein ABGX22_14930 [Pirellulaceae bacterium]